MAGIAQAMGFLAGGHENRPRRREMKAMADGRKRRKMQGRRRIGRIAQSADKI